MSDTQALEEQLESNKLQIEKGALIEQLLKDRKFKKIIIEDFCRDEVVRNMNLAADPGMPPEGRADCLSMAYAGGHIKRYFSAQMAMAQAAKNRIHQIEEELVLARSEDEPMDWRLTNG